MLPQTSRYVVGQPLWRVFEIIAVIVCPECGGGGLIYHEETDSRTKCKECRGSGQVPGTRAWVEGPRPVREVAWHEGRGVIYRLWDGEHLVEVREAELFDDPRKARELASERDRKRVEGAKG